MQKEDFFMKEPVNFQIAGRLLDYIRQKRLQPGDLLPPENVLAESLQISRVVLRENLSYLKALNLVASRRGSGYRVQPGCFSGALTFAMHALVRSGLTELQDLQELRRILEIGSIADAVENAEKSDHEEIQAALAELESITEIADDESLKRYTLAELRFHRALLRPAKCQALELVNQALEDFFTYRTELTPEPIRMQKDNVSHTNLAHRALAEAFILGEANAAMLLLRSHLKTADK